MAMLMVSAGLLAPACGPQAKTTDKSEQLEADEAKADPDAELPGEDQRSASFATPTLQPPAAPEGAVVLSAEPWLYVQTCAEPHPCPSLLQPAGDAHCRELRLGGYDSWRLPSKAEVPRFKGVEGLEQTSGYHWTRTPYEEDLGQAWIVEPEDPAGAPSTTIPRDRKPFRIRCVKEP